MLTRKIRVLHVTNSLNYGGLERVIIDICRFLDNSEFEVMVACIKWTGPQAKLLEDAGFRVIELRANHSHVSKYFSFLNLRKVIQDNEIDIVHTHNTGPLLETMLARLTSLSFPQIIHTDHTRARWPDKKKYMLFERIASRYVHAIIAVSEEAKEKLVSFEHIPEDRIDIVDNGISIEKFQEQCTEANHVKKELGVDHFDYVIGLCVVHRKQKGITHLLHALPEIINIFPNLVCVIGGGGPEKSTLEELSLALRLQDHVRFIGPRDDVERILPIYDLYILPSEWEGLPLSLLEAMAARRCIVATTVGAVPKALENGKCGALIPPGNPEALAEAIIGLLKAPEQRSCLAEEAYRCVVEKYSAKAMAANYQFIYRNCLIGSDRSAKS